VIFKSLQGYGSSLEIILIEARKGRDKVVFRGKSFKFAGVLKAREGGR